MSDTHIRDYPVIAQADFTLDMLRNLFVVFEAAADDHPVTIQMCGHGVWAVTFDGARMYLGGRGTHPSPVHA